MMLRYLTLVTAEVNQPNHYWGLNIVNRPGVAGAVLQSPSLLIHPFIHSLTRPFSPNIHSTFIPKLFGLGT